MAGQYPGYPNVNTGARIVTAAYSYPQDTYGQRPTQYTQTYARPVYSPPVALPPMPMPTYPTYLMPPPQPSTPPPPICPGGYTTSPTHALNTPPPAQPVYISQIKVSQQVWSGHPGGSNPTHENVVHHVPAHCMKGDTTLGGKSQSRRDKLEQLMLEDKDYCMKCERLYRTFSILFKVYGAMESTSEKIVNRFLHLRDEDRKFIMAHGSLETFLVSSEYFEKDAGMIVLKCDVPLNSDTKANNIVENRYVKEGSETIPAVSQNKTNNVVVDGRTDDEQLADDYGHYIEGEFVEQEPHMTDDVTYMPAEEYVTEPEQYIEGEQDQFKGAHQYLYGAHMMTSYKSHSGEEDCPDNYMVDPCVEDWVNGIDLDSQASDSGKKANNITAETKQGDLKATFEQKAMENGILVQNRQNGISSPREPSKNDATVTREATSEPVVIEKLSNKTSAQPVAKCKDALNRNMPLPTPCSGAVSCLSEETNGFKPDREIPGLEAYNLSQESEEGSLSDSGWQTCTDSSNDEPECSSKSTSDKLKSEWEQNDVLPKTSSNVSISCQSKGMGCGPAKLKDIVSDRLKNSVLSPKVNSVSRKEKHIMSVKEKDCSLLKKKEFVSPEERESVSSKGKDIVSLKEKGLVLSESKTSLSSIGGKSGKLEPEEQKIGMLPKVGKKAGKQQRVNKVHGDFDEVDGTVCKKASSKYLAQEILESIFDMAYTKAKPKSDATKDKLYDKTWSQWSGKADCEEGEEYGYPVGNDNTTSLHPPTFCHGILMDTVRKSVDLAERSPTPSKRSADDLGKRPVFNTPPHISKPAQTLSPHALEFTPSNIVKPENGNPVVHLQFGCTQTPPALNERKPKLTRTPTETINIQVGPVSQPSERLMTADQWKKATAVSVSNQESQTGSHYNDLLKRARSAEKTVVKLHGQVLMSLLQGEFQKSVANSDESGDSTSASFAYLKQECDKLQTQVCFLSNALERGLALNELPQIEVWLNLNGRQKIIKVDEDAKLIPEELRAPVYFQTRDHLPCAKCAAAKTSEDDSKGNKISEDTESDTVLQGTEKTVSSPKDISAEGSKHSISKGTEGPTGTLTTELAPSTAVAVTPASQPTPLIIVQDTPKTQACVTLPSHPLPGGNAESHLPAVTTVPDPDPKYNANVHPLVETPSAQQPAAPTSSTSHPAELTSSSAPKGAQSGASGDASPVVQSPPAGQAKPPVDVNFLKAEVKAKILNKYPFLAGQPEVLSSLVAQQTSILQYYMAAGITNPAQGSPSNPESPQAGTPKTPPGLPSVSTAETNCPVSSVAPQVSQNVTKDAPKSVVREPIINHVIGSEQRSSSRCPNQAACEPHKEKQDFGQHQTTSEPKGQTGSVELRPEFSHAASTVHSQHVSMSASSATGPAQNRFSVDKSGVQSRIRLPTSAWPQSQAGNSVPQTSVPTARPIEVAAFCKSQNPGLPAPGTVQSQAGNAPTQQSYLNQSSAEVNNSSFSAPGQSWPANSGNSTSALPSAEMKDVEQDSGVLGRATVGTTCVNQTPSSVMETSVTNQGAADAQTRCPNTVVKFPLLPTPAANPASPWMGQFQAFPYPMPGQRPMPPHGWLGYPRPTPGHTRPPLMENWRHPGLPGFQMTARPQNNGFCPQTQGNPAYPRMPSCYSNTPAGFGGRAPTATPSEHSSSRVPQAGQPQSQPHPQSQTQPQTQPQPQPTSSQSAGSTPLSTGLTWRDCLKRELPVYKRSSSAPSGDQSSAGKYPAEQTVKVNRSSKEPPGEVWDDVEDFPELRVCGYDPRRELDYGTTKSATQARADNQVSSSIPGLSGEMLEGIRRQAKRNRSQPGGGRTNSESSTGDPLNTAAKRLAVGQRSSCSSGAKSVAEKSAAADDTNPLLSRDSGRAAAGAPVRRKSPTAAKSAAADDTNPLLTQHSAKGLSRADQLTDIQLDQNNEPDEEEWTQVSKKKKKDPSPATLSKAKKKGSGPQKPYIPGLNYAQKPVPATKASNFERLLSILQQKFPELNRPELIEVIQQVRSKKGSLTGLSMEQILEECRPYSERKIRQKLGKSPTSQTVSHDLTPISPSRPNQEEVDNCVICFEDLTLAPTKKLECGHEFHDKCIKCWVFTRERTCPTCRQHALFPEEFPKLG